MQKDNKIVISSPCVDNCCLNDDDICMGCKRTLQEILAWGEADTQTRMEILERVDIRKKGWK